MATNEFRISVVLFQEGEWWCAQCLEYDIATQAKTLPDLRYELERVLISHISVSHELGRTLFADLDPAPQMFWKMFEKADLRLEGSELPFRVPAPASMPALLPRMRVANLQQAA